MAKIIVDGMGKQCPIPVVMTKKQVEKLDGPADVEVHVDNDTAVQNVTRLGNTLGAQVETEKISDSEFHITLHVGQDAIDAAGAGKGQDAVEACDVVSGRNVVYAFTSRYMGTGDDKLGEKLMKSCIYAITQLDTLPKAMLFYNGGAFLTTEGSDVLEDLKKMEDEAVTDAEERNEIYRDFPFHDGGYGDGIHGEGNRSAGPACTGPAQYFR